MYSTRKEFASQRERSFLLELTSVDKRQTFSSQPAHPQQKACDVYQFPLIERNYSSSGERKKLLFIWREKELFIWREKEITLHLEGSRYQGSHFLFYFWSWRRSLLPTKFLKHSSTVHIEKCCHCYIFSFWWRCYGQVVNRVMDYTGILKMHNCNFLWYYAWICFSINWCCCLIFNRRVITVYFRSRKASRVTFLEGTLTICRMSVVVFLQKQNKNINFMALRYMHN